MFYILYEIRNNLNGKIYVGVHKTRNLDDGYMGSGKVLKRAIQKYGIENFTKTILEQFENAAAMFAREKEVVTEEFLARDDVYNLRRGGFGGFDHINKTGKNKNGSQFNNKDSKWHKEVSRKGGLSSVMQGKGFHNEEARQRGQESLRRNNTRNILGMVSSVGIANKKETFAKIKHQQGLNNSQFGSTWITNGSDNQKIKKQSPIPDGWRKGRTIKK